MKGTLVNSVLPVLLSGVMLVTGLPVAGAGKTAGASFEPGTPAVYGETAVAPVIDSTGTLREALPPKDWTFMVYMAADNTLDYYSTLDLDEMKIAGSTDQVNIVVLADRLGANNTSLYYVENGSLTAITPNPFGPEADMGNPTTLTGFVNWVASSYPANRYALVLWNHGSGWRTLRVMSEPVVKSICQDVSSGSILSLAEMRAALQGGNIMPDLIGFDACQMQMLETAEELKDFMPGTVMVGSEDDEPAEGWPYDTILTALDATPTQDAATLAQTIVNDYVARFPTTTSIAMSAVRLSEINNVTAAVDELADALRLPDEIGNITAARTQIQEFAYPDYVDLYDVADKIQSNVASPLAQAAAVKVKTAVAGAVILSANGTGDFYSHPYTGVHGLSIYFPEATYLTTYGGIGFSSHRWDEFLRWYLNPVAPTWTSVITDPAGDAILGGPDITGVDKGNTGLAGEVAFRVGFNSSLDLTNHWFSTYLDTDENGATGSPDGGAEFMLTTSGEYPAVILCAWNGAGGMFVPVTPVTMYPVSNDGSAYWFIVPLSALNGDDGNVSVRQTAGFYDLLQSLRVTSDVDSGITLPVHTGEATGILTETATLNGSLDAVTTVVPLQVYFQYGLTPMYTNTTEMQSITAAGGNFSQVIRVPAANTTYHYAAVLTDGMNVIYGNDMTFTTLPVTSTTVTVNAPATVLSNTSFTVTLDIGNVTALDTATYNVIFNPAVLQLENVTAGSINGSEFPVISYDPIINGTHVIIQEVPGLDGLNGTGTLAVLHFHSIGAAGTSSLIELVDMVLSSGEAIEIPSVVQNGTVEIIAGANVDISVVLEGGARPPAGWVVPVTVRYFTPGSNVLTAIPVYVFNLTTTKVNSTAVCECPGITLGSYDISIVSPHTLTNVKRNVAISGSPVTVTMGTLREGNAIDNTIININDFGVLSLSFNKVSGAPGFDARADFDRNGIVNISDFGLLSINFNKVSPIEVP